LVDFIFAYLIALILASIILLALLLARLDNWTFRRYDARLVVSAPFDAAPFNAADRPDACLALR
jgi:hypothetical protein